MADAGDASLVACVAFIGARNDPLYFKSFSSEEQAKLQLAVYSSLDAVEVAVNESRSGGSTTVGGKPSSAENFLGLLFPFEDYKIFGYLTNTNVKIIVVVRDVLLREDKVRELFKGLHRLYVDAVSNSFTPLDGTLTSPAFELQVYRLVEASLPQLEYKGPSVLL